MVESTKVLCPHCAFVMYSTDFCDCGFYIILVCGRPYVKSYWPDLTIHAQVSFQVVLCNLVLCVL